MNQFQQACSSTCIDTSLRSGDQPSTYMRRGADGIKCLRVSHYSPLGLTSPHDICLLRVTQVNPVEGNKYGGSFRIIYEPHRGIGWGDCQHSKRTMKWPSQLPLASVGISIITQSPTFRFVSRVFVVLCFLVFVCNLKLLLCQFPSSTQTSHHFRLVTMHQRFGKLLFSK